MKPKFSSYLLLSSAVIFCAAAASGQQAVIPAGGGTSTITRPGSLTDQGFGTFMSNMNEGAISGGLSGKVVLQNHPLLWEPITVVLSCAPGKAAMTLDTNGEGRYFIDHADLPKVYTTESDSLNAQLSQHYEGCSLQAPLPGYRSSAVTITQKNLRDKPVLDNIVLTPDEHAPGEAFSTIGESASPEAAKLFDKAHEDWMHRNFDGAQSDLAEAVKTNPQFAQAWYLLARLQMRTSLADAVKSLTKAQELDPKFEPPCVYLGAIAMEKRDWTTAAKWADRAIALDPAGSPLLWYVSAQADYHLSKNEAARAAAERAVDLDPDHSVPNAEDLLALTLIAKHDYPGALEHLKNSLNYILSGPSVDLIKRQIAFVEQQSTTRQK
ncbi:MAG TPA: tetratricopeptide repeat protein [Acidobacteriaceae bacterium]|nr:tetratricopeptide repeat protein [Acidobacteriaceae bacterium]